MQNLKVKTALSIDIGNTRTKFGLFDQRGIVEVKIFKNEDLSESMHLLNKLSFDGVIISSVNSAVEKELEILLTAYNVIRLSHKTPLPIKIDYKTPETLGRDRIAGVIGAMSQFKLKDILVIDAGTCVTYDFLTHKKVYLGGAISPGVQLRLRAMNNFTSKLPLLYWEGECKPNCIGNTTISSMLSGAINGLIEEIKGFIVSYEKQYPNLKIVITGGDANFFEKELKNGIFADPNLVLKGLNEILLYNRN